MRRTYRSKKEANGTLDHRDMLVNMDEKSSAFEAFYIHNIKQTKRELSCISSTNNNGVVSNRVRKRKYVKRIVKELMPVRQRDTMSSSAYLTPDKSIRVNKILDPFDMLLNSSSTSQDAPEVARTNTSEKKLPKKVNKVYTRKRQPKMKNFKYSSTDSNCTESDKENSVENSNITDIRTHQLLVERQPSESPKYFDDSINKIVNNMSLINNLRRKSSKSSFNTSFKLNDSRRTKYFHSPILQKSPLCSTPYREKYRGVSIYKFSPISQKDEEISPSGSNNIEEKDDSNKSIILVSKCGIHKIPKDKSTSPLTPMPSQSIKNKSYLLENEANNVSDMVIHENVIDNEIQIDKADFESIADSRDKVEDFEITKAEPFMGFSNVSDKVTNENDLEHEICQENTAIESMNDSKLNTEVCSFEIAKDEPFLGFSNIESEDNQVKISLFKCLEDERIEDEVNHYDDITEMVYESNSKEYFNGSNMSIASNQCNTSQSSSNTHSLSLDSNKESMYDTCNSDQISDADSLNYNKEPVLKVAIERMSDSLFMKYYEKMIIQSQHDSDQTDNDDYESFANDSESDNIENKQDAIIITDSSTTEDVISSNGEGESNDEDICVSFVTTRRRNEMKNYSMFILDNSYNISSSTDCDKTVLSNKRGNFDKSDLDDNVNIKNTEINTESTDKEDNRNVKENSPLNVTLSRRTSRISQRKSNDTSPENAERFSMVTSRRTSRSSRNYFSSQELDTTTKEDTLIEENKNVVESDKIKKNSICPKKPDLNSPMTSVINRDGSIMCHMERSSYGGSEMKPSIVLQPGKKWERSLSIYRRMTMMADHFDESVLEEECLATKGRKYRQSVINTMVMQEHRDSLHNDSINSRRSTFHSKPGRPTIRFVKDPNLSRVSLNTSSLFEDLKGFLNEECDDTVIELSKLSIADSEHEVTILDNFHESDRVVTARDYVLRRCNQTEPLLFDECYPESVLKNCHKIGEGVYGEVFLWRARDGRARVMKIIPIAGTVKVNGEDQKDFHEIISEIVIAMELSALRAPIADIERQLDEGNDIHALDLHAIQNATDIFNEVLAVRCVYGPYPSRLLDLWELYDECKGSENDNPASLPANQRYIVLELANAGQDLESYQFTSAQQAYALFQQIALGLAVGEESCQFEHRDLHWGNVLIAPTEQKLATFVVRGRTFRPARHGVAATVIDYSLSRVTVATRPPAALYNDLATDDQLFDAVGDYQFEVYRLMRDKLGNDWKNFEPYTNILWLHYIVDKMITALRYKKTNTKIHKHYIEKLKGIKERILEYGSAVQFVLTDIEF